MLVLLVPWLAVASACRPDVDRPSLLLLTLDTTRADRLGAYGKEEAGTRHLDRLAEEGALFEWAFTAVPITLPAHATILTGTYPRRHGVHDNGVQMDPGLVSLAEILAGESYRTAAFISAFPLYARFGLDPGFEVYDDDFEVPGGSGQVKKQRLAEEVVAKAARWLETLDPDDRFFLWVHFYDPHWDYSPPALHRSIHAADLYQGEIAYMDKWIGKLLAHLESSGRRDDTLVVAVGDHGEGLGDHEERTHAQLIYNSTMRVPLILQGAGITPGIRVGSAVGTVDLLPTVLDLLSLEPPDQIQGASFAPQLTGQPVPTRPLYLESTYSQLHYGWSELEGVVADGWKYVEAASAGGRGELYELASDPNERHDRISDQPQRVQRLRELLDSFRRREARQAPDTPKQELTADVRKELEALGYLTGRSTPIPDRGEHDPRQMLAVADAYTQAEQMMWSPDLRPAARQVRKVEKAFPGSLAAHKIRGRYQLMLGMQDPKAFLRALEELQAALALSPESATEWRYVAEAHFAMGNWPEGLHYLGQAVSLAPREADLQRLYRDMLEEASQRAEELKRAGQHEEAAALGEVLATIEAEAR